MPLRLLTPKVASAPVSENTSPRRMVSPEAAAEAGEACGTAAVAAGADFFSQPTANSTTAAVVAAKSVFMGEPLLRRKAGVF